MEILTTKSSIAYLPQYLNLYRACFPNALHLRHEYLTWLYDSNPVGSFVGADAIVGSEGEAKVSDIWRDFKKFTSKEIIATIKTEISESRSEWMLNRFEYSGKNDKKIKNYRFWQEGNDAQGIYLNEYFEQKLNYIHYNPVKAEIVNRPEDYRYSSAIDYAGGKGLLKVVVV